MCVIFKYLVSFPLALHNIELFNAQYPFVHPLILIQSIFVLATVMFIFFLLQLLKVLKVTNLVSRTVQIPGRYPASPLVLTVQSYPLHCKGELVLTCAQAALRCQIH